MSIHTSPSSATSPGASSGTVEQVRFSHLWWIGLLTIAAAVVANLIIYALAVALIDVSPEFLPLSSPVPTIIFTVLGGLAAVNVFALVGRFARRPRRTYIIVAVVALLVSLVPDVMMLIDPSGFPFEGVTTAGVLTLMAQHVVAAVVIVWLLLTQALEAAPAR